MPTPPARVRECLSRQVGALGDRPLVTYYDAETGERTELGYATFGNWAAKTANLLADAGAERGDVVVAVDGHWTALVVVVACGLAGARAIVAPGPPPERWSQLAVVHERHATASEGPRRLLVGTGLSGRLAAPGDDAFVDEVLACDDDYADPGVTPDDEWLVLDGSTTWTQGEALARTPDLPGDRILLTVPIEQAVPEAIAVLARGASMVILRGGDADSRRRVSEAERCTGALPRRRAR